MVCFDPGVAIRIIRVMSAPHLFDHASALIQTGRGGNALIENVK